MRSVVSASLLLLLCAVSTADEGAAIRAFERAKASEPELIAFLRQMPKGGDLHNHVTGAVFSDYLLDAQIARGRYFDPATNQFTNDSSKVPASQLLSNSQLLYGWLNLTSMRGWMGGGQSGHDLFFNSFSYLGSAMDGMASAEILKEVVGRALWQNEHYLELMTDVASDAGYDRYMAAPTPDSSDMKAALDTLMPRLEALLADSSAFLTARDLEVTRLLGLKRNISDPSSPTTVRYIWSCNRLSSNDRFFMQAAAGLYLASREPRVVGLNIVAPEDHPNARRNFDRQMQILDFLWKEFGRPNITLHAAELNLEVSPVEPMRDRIWKTIELGHAKRIGHGVALPWSDRVEELLSMMKRNGIAVEICLSSNNSILGVSGDRHPLKMYQGAGVPIFLNTDDEGVSRSNLTVEHVRAVRDQGLDYKDLKQMARNSLEYSFLSGDSLYIGRDFGKLRPELAGVRSTVWTPSAKAQELLAKNEKLAVQVRLERSFVAFENRF